MSYFAVCMSRSLLFLVAYQLFVLQGGGPLYSSFRFVSPVYSRIISIVLRSHCCF